MRRQSIRRAAQSLRRMAARTFKRLACRSNNLRVLEEPLGRSGRSSPTQGDRARVRLQGRGIHLALCPAPTNEWKLSSGLLLSSIMTLRSGLGRDARRRPTERIQVLSAGTGTIRTMEPTQGSPPTWRAPVGHLRPLAAHPLFSGLLVSVFLGAALMLLLSILRLGRAQWTHRAACAQWATERAAAARLQSRARIRGAQLRLHACRGAVLRLQAYARIRAARLRLHAAAATVLQREARRWLSRSGLSTALSAVARLQAATEASMDTRAIIRALVLDDGASPHATLRPARAAVRLEGVDSCLHAVERRLEAAMLLGRVGKGWAVRQVLLRSGRDPRCASAHGLQRVQRVQRLHELQALQGVHELQELHPLQGLQELLYEPQAAVHPKAAPRPRRASAQGLHVLQGVQGVQGVQALQGLQELQELQGLQGLQWVLYAERVACTCTHTSEAAHPPQPTPESEALAHLHVAETQRPTKQAAGSPSRWLRYRRLLKALGAKCPGSRPRSQLCHRPHHHPRPSSSPSSLPPPYPSPSPSPSSGESQRCSRRTRASETPCAPCAR